MDPAIKKQVLRLIPYGLYAVGVRRGDFINLFTANFLSQCAFEPPMLMLAVENDSKSIQVIRETGVFVVSIFATGQRELAGKLGKRYEHVPNKAHEVSTHPGPTTGAPVLDDALGFVECRVAGSLPSGDHTVFVAEVVDVGLLREGEALTMAEAGFRHAG